MIFSKNAARFPEHALDPAETYSCGAVSARGNFARLADLPSRGLNSLVNRMVWEKFPRCGRQSNPSDAGGAASQARDRPQKTSQQLRLFRHDGVADGDAAAGGHFGIDTAIAVAEAALQRLRDSQIALGSVGGDVDGGPAGKPLDHLEPGVTDCDPAGNQVAFVPRRPALDLTVGAEAERPSALPSH